MKKILGRMCSIFLKEKEKEKEKKNIISYILFFNRSRR